jgi:hypothetical protein
LTTEVWETQNQTWLEFQRMVATNAFERTPSDAFEWVKFRSHLSRGVTVGTMLQDEAFHFLRIGSFLERADNTARLLDVKFHAVETEFFGAGLGPRYGSVARGRRPGQSLGGMTQSQGFAAAEAAAEASARRTATATATAATSSTTSITGRRSCARCPASRSTARSIAT